MTVKQFKRLSGKILCEYLNLDYYYLYNTWSNNNRKIERLQSTILSSFTNEQIEKFAQIKSLKVVRIGNENYDESELKPSADFKAEIFIEFAVHVSQIFFFEPHLYLKKQG